MSSESRVPAVAVVGPSKSGKTRVASALVETFTAWGLRVVAVKHARHGHQIDRPATDSARLFQAGAAKVVLSSPGKVTIVERRDDDLELEEIAGAVGPGYDLVIAEGFKRSSVPKILVLGDETISPAPGNVIATVGDRMPNVQAPVFGHDEMDRLAEHVADVVLGSARAPAGARLVPARHPRRK